MGNRWLEGNFAPVMDEVELVGLEVEGAIPPSLTGRYLRTGPNPFAADPDNHHWFVGNGMVHGVELRDGAANWYRNRWVRGPAASEFLGEVPVPRCDGGLFPGDGNTNVLAHGGRILALEELSCPYELDRDLRTIGQYDFGGPLPVGTNAHPKIDPATGEMHLMGYSFADDLLRYMVIDRDGVLQSTREIRMGASVMVHDTALTATRVLALDLPVVFDLELAARGVRLPYRWDADHRARVGLVPRGGAILGPGDDVVWIDVDPCYVFHPLNAYDEGDAVVVDVVRHPSMFAEVQDGPMDGAPWMERWVLDPVRGCSTTVLDERAQEFPRIDERFTGTRHRIGWAAGASIAALGSTDASVEGSVLRYDMDAGTVAATGLGRGRVGGEFVFVPGSDDAAEGEGWLLGYVNDLSTATAELLVLDATSMATEARVRIPRRIPAGFHGNWVPDRAL